MGTFGTNLGKLLKERRLSLKALSESTGIPRSTLSEWVGGRNPQISDDLVMLAKVLDVSLEHLITGSSLEADLVQEIIKSTEDHFTRLHQGVYRITVEKQMCGK